MKYKKKTKHQTFRSRHLLPRVTGLYSKGTAAMAEVYAQVFWLLKWDTRFFLQEKKNWRVVISGWVHRACVGRLYKCQCFPCIQMKECFT